MCPSTLAGIGNKDTCVLGPRPDMPLAGSQCVYGLVVMLRLRTDPISKYPSAFLQGAYSHPRSSVGSTKPEPPGSLLRHNALLNLHSNPAMHKAPAPAPMSFSGPASTPHIAPATSVAAPGVLLRHMPLKAAKK